MNKNNTLIAISIVLLLAIGLVAHHSFANWKTYTSEKYGFSIRYPSNWYIEYPDDGADIHIASELLINGVDYPPGTVVIEVQANLPKRNDIDLLTFISEDIKNKDVMGRSSIAEPVMLGGRTFIKTDGNVGEGPVGPGYFIERNPSQFFGISVYGTTQEETVTKIISTLTFTEPTNQVSDLQDEYEHARQALVNYFALLDAGNYAGAAMFHGSGYDYLQDLSEDINPKDHAALLEQGCRIFHCLPIKKILSFQQVAPTEFIFTVQFQEKDGTAFVKLGPCCGAEGPKTETTDFEYTVKKIDGRYLVITQPIYTP